MSDADFDIKRGDLLPKLRATLYGADGAAANLEGAANVKLYMRTPGGALKIDGGACAVINQATGVVEYEWVAGDTDTPGLFVGEFKVTFSAAKPQTFPNDGDYLIRVHEDVA